MITINLLKSTTVMARILLGLAVCVLLVAVATVAAETDYYDLLGVAKDADSRTIRKAFKKLAVTKHPDKNADNPKAHDEFTVINRAYEVLKDPDLRKKYDQFGEEGLKNDHPSNQYKSWNYYQQDFGLYDNDDEIVTLDHAEFNQKVGETDELWFVNFYSPQCGHCHTLAPTWREVGRELEGVVRIAAVNCGEDWFLCNQEGIRSYPTLIMYPAKRRYQQGHIKETLVDFALSFLQSTALDLTKFNFKSTLKSSKRKALPWLITYCGDGGDCLSKMTVKKLAAIFEGLINIASIDCYNANKEVCEEMGAEHGTYFYKKGKVVKNEGKEVTSLDFKEVTKTLLQFLPDLKLLDEKKFGKIQSDLYESKTNAWLVMFNDADTHDPELRKLPAILPEYHVGRVDCRQSKTLCRTYHIHKFPTFLIFKKQGLFEYHYGRANTHDVAEFAKQCAENSVSALGPDDFPGVTNSDNDKWIIDFFAPWCPPCMRLLPEFRKASRSDEVTVRFGTVDCAIHQTLCQQHKVKSYPSTIFYNHSTPFQYKGQHSDRGIITFIQDVLDPPGVIFNEQIWDELIEQKNKDEIWLVDFYAPWCGPCQRLAPEWRRLAKMLKGHKTIHVGEVNCQEHQGLCNSQNVRSYPNVRLYPIGKKQSPSTFQGWFMDAESIRSWAYEFLPTSVVDLKPDDFRNKVLRSKEPWVVDFYAPWCGPCRQFFSVYNEVAQEFEGRVKFGKVDCERFNPVCQEARVRFLPSIRLYRGLWEGQNGAQDTEGESIDADAHIIRHMLNQIVPSSESADEPNEPMFFEHDEF